MKEILEIGNKSVHFIESVKEIDRSFIDEVPLVPEKLLQGNIDSLMGNAVNKLFECNIPAPFAIFPEFKGYQTSIKRLFSNKVLASFNIDVAKEVLDDFFENEKGVNEEEGEKLYEMLDELTYLNLILEEIYLRILSCLKP
jgi:hypothetical protein